MTIFVYLKCLRYCDGRRYSFITDRAIFISDRKTIEIVLHIRQDDRILNGLANSALSVVRQIWLIVCSIGNKNCN